MASTPARPAPPHCSSSPPTCPPPSWPACSASTSVAATWQRASAGDWAAYAAEVSRRTTAPPAHQIGNPASHAIPAPGLAPGKYARIERERRFLLAGLPPGERPADGRTIIDHYLTGTTLRLRCVLRPGGDQYKLTQKIPAAQPGPVQGLITNIYLSKAEHDQLAAALQGKRLAKTRYTIPPLSIDVFDPPLHGLITGEAEFGTDAEMLAFQPPGYIHAEITDDPRFTGGRLATTPREDLVFWLTQYGISPNDPDLIQHG
jgi:CYTH domain-containing protein